MTRLALDYSRLLGFRIDSAAGVKIGNKPGMKGNDNGPIER
ncbi:hypothetical protein [Histidinibacterium lentulum]|nr:hypothetical protein [Histidinibacterium lentulum]